MKEEDWPPFNEYIEQARTALEQTRQIASRDPHWYVTMAVVARSQHWPDDTFREMLEEGLSRYPDYYPIYYSAVDFYSPKWNGSADAIEQFLFVYILAVSYFHACYVREGKRARENVAFP